MEGIILEKVLKKYCKKKYLDGSEIKRKNILLLYFHFMILKLLDKIAMSANK